MRFTPADSTGRPDHPDGRLGPMKIAHVRERNAPAGTPWRLAARSTSRAPIRQRWLDLEEARQGLVVEDPRRAHNSLLFRQPITTLDDAPGSRPAGRGAGRGGRGLRRGRRRGRGRPGRRRTSCSGRRSCSRPACATSTPSRGTCRTMWERRGGTVPEAWYRLPDLLLRQRLRDPRPGRAGLVPGGIDGARLRAGGGGADRYAGA